MIEYADSKSIIALKALELFMQYGIRSVSMDDIAGAAGMSKKTIYLHYANKDALVMGVVKAILLKHSGHCELDRSLSKNAVHEVFLAIDGTTELFRRMNPLMIFDLKKYHPRAYKIYAEFKSDFLYKVIKSNLERGVKEGLYRPDLLIEVVTRHRVESVLIPFIPNFYNNVAVGLDEANKELFYLFLFGVASPKGYKLIEKYKKTKTLPHAKS